jgi:hypothetical protein
MASLLNKIKPILTKQGVFYPNSHKDVIPTIVLEEINRKANFSEDYLKNHGKVFGFSSYHELTSEPANTLCISKKIGNPGIYLILNDSGESSEPIDYSLDLKSALEKAHDYIFKELIKEAFSPLDGNVYSNLLDQTKVGLKKFKSNKANLSEQSQGI